MSIAAVHQSMSFQAYSFFLSFNFPFQQQQNIWTRQNVAIVVCDMQTLLVFHFPWNIGICYFVFPPDFQHTSVTFVFVQHD